MIRSLRDVGLVTDYVQPGDATMGPAHERYKAAFDAAYRAASKAERAADLRRADFDLRKATQGRN